MRNTEHRDWLRPSKTPPVAERSGRNHGIRDLIVAQPIRRSQFITTYGPGAVLEGPDGPRVIPTMDGSRIFSGRRPTDFEITDQRLSRALLNGAGILRLPTNPELGQGDFQAVYDTKSFPSWSLCVRMLFCTRRPAMTAELVPAVPPIRIGSRPGVRPVETQSALFAHAPLGT
jgi:hypothetical protein